MTRFRCTSCNYRYEPKGNKFPKVCPACGRDTIGREKSASELLSDFTEDYIQ